MFKMKLKKRIKELEKRVVYMNTRHDELYKKYCYYREMLKQLKEKK